MDHVLLVKMSENISLDYFEEQEAQLMLTNPHDAFRGQSRSPNIVPFHMLGTFPLVQSKTRRFSNIRLEIQVTGHSRSLKEVPFYRLGVVSY